MVACVVADATGWHPAVTGPGIVACVAALTACLLRLRLKGGRQ
jgi:sugar phosphate permease